MNAMQKAACELIHDPAYCPRPLAFFPRSG